MVYRNALVEGHILVDNSRHQRGRREAGAKPPKPRGMSEKFSVENRHVPDVKYDESLFTSRSFTIEELPVQPKTLGFGEALPGAFFSGRGAGNSCV
jgi:hypothetical protein